MTGRTSFSGYAERADSMAARLQWPDEPRPVMPTAATHGRVTVAEVEAAGKAQQEWDERQHRAQVARRLELMRHTPITLDDVLSRFWVGGRSSDGANLLNDNNRAAFFSVWAIAARELADAFINEANYQ
jgi:hypothetical protein